MKIERTTDFEYMDAVRVRLSSNTVPDGRRPNENLPSDNRGHIFLSVEIEGKQEGFFWITNEGNGQYCVHAYLDEGCRGSKALEAIKLMKQWLIDNTDCKTLWAVYPEHLRTVHWFARLSGFEFFKRIPKVWPRNGKLIDLICSKLILKVA